MSAGLILRGWALMGVAVTLAACADYGPGPAMIGGSQNGVVVRADPDRTSDTEVDRRASSFCRSYDRIAVRRGEGEYKEGVVYYGFDCMEMEPVSPALEKLAP